MTSIKEASVGEVGRLTDVMGRGGGSSRWFWPGASAGRLSPDVSMDLRFCRASLKPIPASPSPFTTNNSNPKESTMVDIVEEKDNKGIAKVFKVGQTETGLTPSM